MTILYVSTDDNKICAVKVDEAGNLDKIIETVQTVVDPLPANVNASDDGGGGPKLASEWLDKHPTKPLLYVLTSFWDKAFAVLTTYKITTTTTAKDGTNKDDDDDSKLVKLGSCETGGYQAAHGTFSPDGSTYVVGHHNDGRLSFFDVSTEQAPTEPLQILRLTETKPDTLREPAVSFMGVGLPSCHGVSYAPNGKYLIAADPVQDAVFTYTVDKQGRPVADTTRPCSILECSSAKNPPGWFGQALRLMLGLKARPRRAIVHPNGKYLYVLHEVIGNIQVYAVSETGTMDPVCLQEITAVDPEAYQAWFIGVALSSGSELEAGTDNLYLSIRGMAAPGGRCESGLRLLSYHDDGARLELGDMIETPAAVRHFSKVGDTLWVGLNSKTKTLVQKYTKASSNEKYELKGEANVGFDVMCVVPFDP